MNEIAGQLAPNAGDEAWVVDVNQQEHTHADGKGQHADGWHVTNDGSGATWEKYHSDDN